MTDDIAKEITIHKIATFDNLISYKGNFKDKEGKVYIKLEKMDRTLDDRIKEEEKLEKPFPLIKIWAYVIQLCWGVAYLNMLGVCHMDIKPDNILLKGRTLKIADFGVSKRIAELNEESKDTYIGPDWKATLRTSTPEMIQGKNL